MSRVPAPEFDRAHISLRPQAFRKTLHLSRVCGAVYVNNPKVACSTIKLALQRAELGDPAYVPETSVHDHHVSPLLTWPELKMGQVRQVLKDHLVFSFVRCPYRRLQSAYANKIVRPQKKGRFRVEAGFGVKDEPEFEDFVRAVADQDPLQHNPHWRAQSINLSVDAVAYDFIGRLERFVADWAELSGQLGLPDKPERHGKRTSAAVAAYTPRSAALVAQVYARDFEVFGYDPDDVPG